MAFTHLQFNDQLQHGRQVRSAVNKLDQGLDELGMVIATLATMIDGDSGDAANFTEMASRLGTASNATAKGVWDELNSAYSKISTDNSVSSVNAALKQVANKLR